MAIYLKCGNLIDGTGAAPVKDAAVVIDDGEITAVGLQATVSVPDGAETIDLSEKTVMPGMMDVHVHLLGIEHFSLPDILLTPTELAAIRCVPGLRRMLEAGFTTVRDVGSHLAIALRDAVNEGTIPGPRKAA